MTFYNRAIKYYFAQAVRKKYAQNIQTSMVITGSIVSQEEVYS